MVSSASCSAGIPFGKSGPTHGSSGAQSGLAGASSSPSLADDELARKININVDDLPPKWTLSHEASASPDDLGSGSDCASPPASFRSQSARFTRGFTYLADSTGAGSGNLVSVVSFSATSSDARHNADIIDSVAYKPCLI